MPISFDTSSVLSPVHPANLGRRSSDSHSANYIYRLFEEKLRFTLGWELEANHRPVRKPEGVEHIGDGSVNGDGAEYVVLPAVTKSPRYVLNLLKELVHAPKLNTDKSCGFHIHVSASNLSLNKMRQWAIATEHLAQQIEDKAFNAVPDSRKGNSYCRRINPITSGASFNSRKYDNDRRYHWLNTVEMFRPGGIRTIEVRLLGNTHRWKYLLSWSLFCMELASRGWTLSQRPFDIKPHVDALGEMLDKITTEIKPLEKRMNPIPQWVYDGLEKFGMPSNSWDRPLARQSEVEAELNGYPKKFYSDNQITEENDESDHDDNDSRCECGCGDEGTCDNQRHSDGDCDNNYCIPCHENGECGGTAACENCIAQAHNDNEDCTRTHCMRCERRHRTPTPTPQSERQVTEVTPDAPIYGRSFVEMAGSVLPRLSDIRLTYEPLPISLSGAWVASPLNYYEVRGTIMMTDYETLQSDERFRHPEGGIR